MFFFSAFSYWRGILASTSSYLLRLSQITSTTALILRINLNESDNNIDLNHNNVVRSVSFGIGDLI